MRSIIAITGGLALAVLLSSGSVIAPHGPRSRLARDLTVLWQGTQQVRRIGEAGSHELEFPCSYVEGATARLTVEVTRQEEGRQESGDYRDCTAAEARQLALAGSEARVRLTDRLAEVRPAGGTQLPVLSLPDGRQVPIACAFTTAGGANCLVPAHRRKPAEFIRAALPGDELTIRGRLLRTQAGEPALLVEALGFPAEPVAKDEPPWTVVVRWGGREAARLSMAGDYPLELPCLHRDGATEHVWLRLREFRMVDLKVDGHPVAAELADTPARRAWGLQGRGGLEPGEGMLFYFPRPLRPTFVMMTVSFPISIAFIRSDGTIVNIERLNPGDRHAVTSTVPVPYVLEVEQGWFRQHDVEPGDWVRIP